MRDSNITELIKDFNSGMTYDNLCKKYHHQFKTVKKILIENGVDITARDKVDYITSKNILTKVGSKKLEEIITKYLAGKSKNWLSKKYGYSPRQIEYILKKSGVELRSVSNKKYFLNDNFFDTMTHEGAYIIGLLAADGWIKKNDNMISLSLQITDVEILEKIKEILQLDRPLNYYDKATDEIHRQPQVELCFSSAKIHKQLALYDLVPNKTFKILHLPPIDDEFMKDYIRGYMDGDGSISYKKHTGSWNITSVNKSFLEDIQEYLYKNLAIPKVRIYEDTRKDHSCYSFFYTNKDSLKKIYEWLYYPNALYMERKYKKFTELYNIINDIECHEASVPQNAGTKDMLNS